MSGVSSAVNSIFTPSGTNQRLGQAASEAQVGGLSAGLANSLSPGVGSAISAQSNYTPQLNQSLQSFINSFSGTGSSALNQMNAGAQSNFGTSTKLGNAMLASGGMGSSFQAGNTIAGQNALSNQLTQNTAYVNSPTFQQQQLAGVTGAESTGMNQASGQIGQLSQLSGNTYGQPAYPVQANPLSSTFGNLAGIWASSPMGFGGGS